MSNIKKRNVTIVFVAFLFVLALIIVLLFPKTTKLTDAEISNLRTQYPICGTNIPFGATMKSVSLDECIQMSDSFVYGEVVGDVRYYSVSNDLGDAELQAKRKANGIDDVNKFYEYTISVMDDTEGKYTPNTQITISANVLLKDFNPNLQDGMKVIVPVIRDDNVTARNYYTVYGMFYVTDDEYALSVYEEGPQTRSPLSGEKVEVLMERLKK